MRLTLLARLKIGDSWSGVDVGPLTNAALGPLEETAPLEADAVFDSKELIPMLEPVLCDEGAGVCSRAVVLSLRKPVSAPTLDCVGRDGGVVVKDTPFAWEEASETSKFTLSLNRRMGERPLER
jgi:hypothetical protein